MHQKTGKGFLRAAAVVMAAAAVVWLGYEFWRLLFQPPPLGARDLFVHQRQAQGWFSGRSATGKYPPASYAFLWLLVGWVPFGAARWIWAALMAASLAAVSILIVRYSRASSAEERSIAALMAPSSYAAGAAIGNGQPTVTIVLLVAVGVLLAVRREHRWIDHLGAAALLILALEKPTIVAPFLWIVLFASGSIRPAALIATGYLAVFGVAIFMRHDDLASSLTGWIDRASLMATEPGQGNVANLPIVFATLGAERWALPAELLIFFALGAWTFRHRRADVWLLMGVTAYVARLFTYHRWYDDLIIVLPMTALFRLAKEPPGGDAVAGWLLAATTAAMLAPGGLFFFPAPWNTVYVVVQVAIWCAGMIFLGRRATGGPR